MTKRAQRTDSTPEQIKAAENAHAVHDWPDEAGECSEDSWAIYVKNQEYRAYDDWLMPDLIELGRLSRMQVAAVELQEILDDEGYIVLGGKSGTTKVENPAIRAIGSLNAAINQLTRRLGMTDSGSGDKRTKTNKRDAERAAAAALPQGGNVDEFDRSRLM